MKIEIKVPAMGESISEATIGSFIKPNGSSVKVDDELLELETDKVNQVLYAQQAGTVSWNISEGDHVKIGQVIGSIDESKEPAQPAQPAQPPQPAQPAAKGNLQASKKEAVKAEAKSEPKEAVKAEAKSEAKEEPVKNTPKKENVPPAVSANTPQSSSGARSTKEEFLAGLNEGQPDEAKASGDPAPPQQPESSAQDVPSSRNESRKKMSKIRRVIAERLVKVKQETAMLTTFNEVDMSRIIELRESYKEAFEKKNKVRLGFMPFFVKAAVSAMKAFPEINAYIDGDEIVYREYFDIGIAVGTDKGLFVPVVRSCEKLSFADIERSIESFATKAREGGLSPSDLQGGGFTITNGGTYGSLLSTPILNPPQSAILGMHKIMKRPVVVDDQIVIRQMMYLALSYDHRVVDGKEAVSFLVHIKNALEDPSRLLIGI
ncbi:MAG TPA: 2-oxoglutarate dehydrogenase complex dihydrolipoyllysine-residue succinyltransferase [Parachlamydiaceae bacterium]|nr:2-oxoglutarate dehydrogenase complex dihydrolipoyllysine-residue succinyltransferase [Parachlamydiaceae bacterium]